MLKYLLIFQDYNVQTGQTADPYPHLALPDYLVQRHRDNPTLGLWVGSSLVMRKLGASGNYGREMSWTDLANGAMDKTWRLMGQRAQTFVSPDRPPTRFRGPHEFDLWQWHYSPGTDATDIAAYKTAQKRYYDIVKAECPSAIIEINFVTSAGLGGNKHSFDALLPASNSYDAIAIDCYNIDYNNRSGCNYRPGVDPQVSDAKLQARWNLFLGDPNTDRGLRYLRRRAVELGKPLSMPEVGQGEYLFVDSTDRNTGGGDDPFYVNGLADYVFDPVYPAGSGGPGCVDALAWWEDGSLGVSSNGIMPRTLIGKAGPDTDRKVGVNDAAQKAGTLTVQMDMSRSRAAFEQRFIAGTSTPAPAPGTTTLSTPATNITTSGFRSSWTAATPATSYLVQRRTGSNPFTTVAIVTTTDHTHTGLSAGTAYDVRIIPRNSTTEGTPSNIVTTTTATVTSGTSITLAWDPQSSGATSSRPENTFYRITAGAAGNLQYASNGIIPVTAGSVYDLTFTARASRAGWIDSGNPGWVSINGLNSEGGYRTNFSLESSDSLHLGTSFVSRTGRFTVPSDALLARITWIPYYYNAVVGDYIDIQPTITLTKIS